MYNNFDIYDSLLGKETSTPEKYDASLLFRIPRAENRTKYSIYDNHLPFIGYDVWNCYEFSFLTKNGLPVSRLMKLIYSAESQFLVESKSLKLYLNSFNMERFEESVSDSERHILDIITYDLSRLLETEVKVTLFNGNTPEITPFAQVEDITELIPPDIQESIEFTHYQETPELLQSIKTDNLNKYTFRTDLLRSNCRVTNQPDWGDLFVQMNTNHEINMISVIQYLVSFRKENHFHEEVVEMIYKRFVDAFKPAKLMVAAMYTRRGGIDINPIRASHNEWIDSAFVSLNSRLQKTLRQ